MIVLDLFFSHRKGKISRGEKYMTKILLPVDPEKRPFMQLGFYF